MKHEWQTNQFTWCWLLAAPLRSATWTDVSRLPKTGSNVVALYGRDFAIPKNNIIYYKILYMSNKVVFLSFWDCLFELPNKGVLGSATDLCVVYYP